MNNTVEYIAGQYRTQRENYPASFRLRVHRALSWLQRAETLLAGSANKFKIGTPNSKTHLSNANCQTINKTETDFDLAFISLWIAFNAVYARDLELKTSQDRVLLRDFLATVCRLDKAQRIYQLVWQVFSSDIRALLGNRYVFQPFWDFHNGLISKESFEDAFQSMRKKANTALTAQDTEQLLALAFGCLYTLRNQLVHGGATWNSSANRQQIKSATAFLSKIMPVFLQIMMENPHHQVWGKPFYPYIKDH